MKLSLFIVLSCLFPQSVLAFVELNGSFSYQKQVFGSKRENNIRSRTYGGSVAVYLFDYTALEFNYTENHEVTTTHDTFKIDETNFSLIGTENRVMSRVAGVGIRQALSPRNSSFRPLISLGYARQFVNDKTNLTLRNDVTNGVEVLPGSTTKRRVDSVFVTFGLDIRLTKMFALKGSVNSVFKAFKFNEAKDNLKYLIGFSWYL